MDTGSLHDLKRDLFKLIKRLSYREGDFILASGKKSSFYIDLKATTLHPDGAYLIGEVAFQTIVASGFPVDAVGGLTLGADPLATAISLAARSHGVVWPAYIVRKESKDHGTGRYIEGVENLRPGASVLVLEDVVTTGGSSQKAIDRLKDAGYKPVATLTVVDRQQGGKELLTQQGLKFLSLATLDDIRGV